MSSSNGSSSSSSSHDALLLQSLMSRLQLRPPYLDTNSFLSQSLDDFLLPSDQEDHDDDEDDGSDGGGDEESRQVKRSKLLAKEEAKLEREIIKIIHSGKGQETLRANSGQSVAIGDHNICVSVHEESGSDYQVWEWHGHIMFFDEVDGYSAEYIYGNYFERLLEKAVTKNQEEEEDEEEVAEEESKFEGEGNSGLKDLIEGLDNLMSGGGGSSNGGRRVVHRNWLHAAK